MRVIEQVNLSIQELLCNECGAFVSQKYCLYFTSIDSTFTIQNKQIPTIYMTISFQATDFFLQISL